jgi:tetratricopeptide (TPR) repeat protein
LGEKILRIPQARWRESGRERRFEVHRATEALLLVQFEDGLYTRPDYLGLFEQFENELKSLVDLIANYYQDNGFVVRMLFAKLLAGGKIPEHTDSGYSLLNCHRIHIPVITNDDVVFFVGGEEKNLHAGECCELNNGINHAVENRSKQDRIHIIIDWMPNRDRHPLEQVLVPDQSGDTGVRSERRESLNRMIAEAQRHHQAGNLAEAELIYRQVLDSDTDHVIANNLFGLLCIHTNRFKQATHHIANALAIKPDDAQAHANIGFALKQLDRFTEAASHFRQVLTLTPDDATSHLDLGNVYTELGQATEAVACYQQAVTIRPDYAEAHQNLGSAFLQLHKFAEAQASLEEALALKPDLPKARTNLDRARNG